jgi:MFS family permease
MPAGLGLIALGLLLMPFAANLPLLLVAISALSLGMGLTQPSINSLISRRAGAERQGEVMGVAQSAGALSRVLGPIAAGALFAGFGRNAPFLWGAALVAAALAIAWRMPRAVAAPLAAQGQKPVGAGE